MLRRRFQEKPKLFSCKNQDFYILDDPLEQHNLYDEMPKLVQFLLDKINKDKWDTVQNLLKQTTNPASPQYTLRLEDFLVPRPNFCDPKKDSPIIPVDPRCISPAFD